MIITLSMSNKALWLLVIRVDFLIGIKRGYSWSKGLKI